MLVRGTIIREERKALDGGGGGSPPPLMYRYIFDLVLEVKRALVHLFHFFSDVGHFLAKMLQLFAPAGDK